ncbi:virulence factor TspB C-terminal domain-related protein [Gilvimarinus sp. 1_MG-2023]|uniref:virulence factor TspB C-terminal domain-related protein n=1 Tax=Gilvimarinus sp. 1_MG-2023 TaxID=3062638 RepID=UPI0026E2C085|nr:virulence factor TspB C-terminal domain-related protein [Gilvimarinus sp. 1_MG-2023]MDO6748528.1 virulence factor TspB C-terminal domain-related protein [Gilvimarinus sp. 1_MG-2023]
MKNILSLKKLNHSLKILTILVVFASTHSYSEEDQIIYTNPEYSQLLSQSREVASGMQAYNEFKEDCGNTGVVCEEIPAQYPDVLTPRVRKWECPESIEHQGQTLTLTSMSQVGGVYKCAYEYNPCEHLEGTVAGTFLFGPEETPPAIGCYAGCQSELSFFVPQDDGSKTGNYIYNGQSCSGDGSGEGTASSESSSGQTSSTGGNDGGDGGQNSSDGGDTGGSSSASSASSSNSSSDWDTDGDGDFDSDDYDYIDSDGCYIGHDGTRYCSDTEIGTGPDGLPNNCFEIDGEIFCPDIDGDGEGDGGDGGGSSSSSSADQQSSSSSSDSGGSSSEGSDDYMAGTCSEDAIVAPECNGDAIQCAIEEHTFKIECNAKLWREDLSGDEEYNAKDSLLDSPDDNELNKIKNEEIDHSLAFSVDDSGFLGGGACPTPETISIAGASIEFSYQSICDLAALLQPLLIALGYFIGAMVFLRTYMGL